MRVVFMGTPEFAVPSLAALADDSRHEVVGVVTQPDRVNRRGGKVAFSPVKDWALAHGFPVYQPTTIRAEETLAQLRAWQADVFVVVAYGKILPAEVLHMPTYGCINVHASLLPKYRGAAPIQYSIWNGDTETGVTIMRLDEGMDTGDIVAQATLAVSEDDDVPMLTEKLAALGADLLTDVLRDLPAALTQARAQNHEAATYTQKISKEEGRICWQHSANRLCRQVNALHANPGVYTRFRNRRLKLHRVVASDEATTASPGSIVHMDAQGIHIATGEGILVAQLVQPENKKQMSAADFMNGYQLRVGERFGESED